MTNISTGIGAIGLCGAHCTGKSTLGAELSDLVGIPFAATSASATMLGMKIPPDEVITSFSTRMEVQEAILEVSEDLWGKFETPFISDRTPMDMLAYTMADIQGNTKIDESRIAKYIKKCIAATNKYFSYFILLQPGIPLKKRKGKALPSEGFMCHLNLILMGLTCSEHVEGEVFWMPVKETVLENRITLVMEWLEEYDIC